MSRMRFMASAMSLLALLGGSTAQAQLLSQQQKLDDYHQLTQIIRAHYGPYDFKIQNKILDIPAQIQNYENLIAGSKGNKDFYGKMIEFVASFQDGHFAIFVPTNRRAVLPLTTDLFGDRVLITKIDFSKLPFEKFNFLVGDEIQSVDGVPASQVLDEISTKMGSGNPKSSRRMASWQILRRSGARMILPENKKVKLVIARGGTSLTEEVELDWIFSGQSVDEELQKQNFFSLKPELGLDIGQIRNEELIRAKEMADIDYACNPITRIALPKDAKWIMQSPVSAYTYETSKGRVGYLRIPHYYPQAKPGQSYQAAFEEWMGAFRFAISKLEKETVGLVIDQDHNCGGSVSLVEDMVGLFMDKKFPAIPFSLRGTKSVYLSLKNSLDGESPNSLEFENYQRILAMVEKTWKENPGAMTPKTAITGRDEVPPDSIVTYSKPVVILIDEMAGSGGDAFPATMKGLGRAKLFGQQTSGLGGSVSGFPALSNSQMSFAMTMTQFYAPNGDPIENNGAMPDRFYERTREDLMLNYRPYQKAYTDYLLEQLP